MNKKADRFYDFIASLLFLFDVDWDEELPNGIGDRPAIRVVKGGRGAARSVS